VLRERARAVDAFDSTLEEVARAMMETMERERGIGLAAPQVGESVRLLVALRMADPDDDAAEPIVVGNPGVL